MTNKKSTKRALITSALAMLMCVAMLIGTTFAWFTDTASTAVNKIQSGTLKVGLQMQTDTNSWTDAEGQTLNFKKASTASGTDVLWEPGCTYELPALRVVNNGNLAFKYKVVVSGIDGDAKLLEAIDFTVKFNDEEVDLDNWEGILLPNGKTATAGTTEEVETSSALVISGHMKEEAGNEYQNLSVDGIGITVYATQYTYEYDSYNNQYDLNSMYVFDDYVNVTKKVSADGDTVIKDKEDATITATVPAGSTTATELALIKKPAKNPSSVKVEIGESALTTDVKIIDTETKQVVTAQGDTFFTIDILLGQVDLQKFYHKGVELTKADSKENLTSAGLYYYDFTTGVVTFTTKDFSTFTAVFNFAGGNGTKQYPYLIGSVGHFENINKYSDSFYYYKVVDGLTEIDCSNITYVDLYGEFDGNDVTFTNINSKLFRYAGYYASETPTVFRNFTAVMNTPNSLVFTIDSEITTFENVKVSGILEGNWNMGAFVNYGTCNASETGYDYTLNFINCSCDATIISKQNSSAGILVGYTYAGANNTVKINLDSATNSGINNAKIYAAPTAQGFKYYGLNWSKTTEVYLDGTKVDNASFPATSLIKTAPVKNDSAYTLSTESGTTAVKAQVVAQLTAYSESGDKIKEKSGITMTLGNIEIGSISGGSVNLMNVISNVEVSNTKTQSGRPEYKIEDGKLTIYTNSTDNYVTGTVSLIASQYNSDKELIGIGTLVLAEKNATTDSSWTIK